ncbi:MAG: VOC family protein [Deltaproteobacteria bacterium]|nr:VOC family protein [Deltaproteobacteria bacterium]MBK8240351.1 VOC family protein [Deltaproteobacteria bacterium]MBK8718369.1 VOC family protein [Deltaproteobacteria bacterium]MBP7290386.1 VOC family protein [Nannocystaceae bacterium]
MSTHEPPRSGDATETSNPAAPTATSASAGTSAPARPFRVLGLQQVAIGSTDKQALRSLWIDLLGVPAHGHFRSERENVDEDILSLGGVELDLMTPIDASAAPKVHEPALNHIGLWVDDLRAAVAWLGERGVRFTPGGIRRGAAGHEVCFIHPKGNPDAPQGGCGVLIELVQAPAEMAGAAV